MKTRLLAAPVVLALALAACGNDPSTSDSDRTEPAPTAPETTVPETTLPTPTTHTPPIPHETGADDVVISLAMAGGFVPPDFLFARLPQLVVTGDGSVYTQGAQIEIY